MIRMSKTEGSKSMQIIAVALIMLCIGVAVGYVYSQSQIPPPPPKRVSLLDKVKQKGQIVVGTSADYPPYESIDEKTKKIIGLDVDIVEAVAKELGVKVTWQDMPFESLVAALETGKVDMIAAGMGLKAERIPKMDYSISYEQGDNVVVVKGDSSVKTFGDLADVGNLNLKIGVQTGTIQEGRVNDLVKGGKIKKENVVSYQRVDLMIADIVSGRIDAAMIDKPVADSFATHYSIKIVYTEWAPPKCLWVPKGEKELLDAVNTAMLKLHKDGVIQQLINKWHST
jgi:polar amino acid transport system substrate-binding protein